MDHKEAVKPGAIEKFVLAELEGLSEEKRSKVALVIGVNTKVKETDKGEEKDIEIAEKKIKKALIEANINETINKFPFPVAIVGSTYKEEKEGKFLYGKMRNDVLHSAPLKILTENFYLQGHHPYGAIQDFDTGSRRVDTNQGEHLFDVTERIFQGEELGPLQPEILKFLDEKGNHIKVSLEEGQSPKFFDHNGDSINVGNGELPKLFDRNNEEVKVKLEKGKPPEFSYEYGEPIGLENDALLNLHDQDGGLIKVSLEEGKPPEFFFQNGDSIHVKNGELLNLYDQNNEPITVNLKADEPPKFFYAERRLLNIGKDSNGPAIPIRPLVFGVGYRPKESLAADSKERWMKDALKKARVEVPSEELKSKLETEYEKILKECVISLETKRNSNKEDENRITNEISGLTYDQISSRFVRHIVGLTNEDMGEVRRVLADYDPKLPYIPEIGELQDLVAVVKSDESKMKILFGDGGAENLQMFASAFGYRATELAESFCKQEREHGTLDEVEELVEEIKETLGKAEGLEPKIKDALNGVTSRIDLVERLQDAEQILKKTESSLARKARLSKGSSDQWAGNREFIANIRKELIKKTDEVREGLSSDFVNFSQSDPDNIRANSFVFRPDKTIETDLARCAADVLKNKGLAQSHASQNPTAHNIFRSNTDRSGVEMAAYAKVVTRLMHAVIENTNNFIVKKEVLGVIHKKLSFGPIPEGQHQQDKHFEALAKDINSRSGADAVSIKLAVLQEYLKMPGVHIQLSEKQGKKTVAEIVGASELQKGNKTVDGIDRLHHRFTVEIPLPGLGKQTSRIGIQEWQQIAAMTTLMLFDRITSGEFLPTSTLQKMMERETQLELDEETGKKIVSNSAQQPKRSVIQRKGSDSSTGSGKHDDAKRLNDHDSSDDSMDSGNERGRSTVLSSSQPQPRSRSSSRH